MAIKRTKIRCDQGVVKIENTETKREFILNPGDWRSVEPHFDVVTVPKGSRATAIVESRVNGDGTLRCLTTDPQAPVVIEVPIEGTSGAPDWQGVPENEVDFFYAGEPYVEITPPGGDEDDSIIIRG